MQNGVAGDDDLGRLVGHGRRVCQVAIGRGWPDVAGTSVCDHGADDEPDLVGHGPCLCERAAERIGDVVSVRRSTTSATPRRPAAAATISARLAPAIGRARRTNSFIVNTRRYSVGDSVRMRSRWPRSAVSTRSLSRRQRDVELSRPVR